MASRRLGWTPPAELVDFLAAGPPPVFVGFGSMVPGDSVRLSSVVADALRRAGLRGVVHSADVLLIGDVPYEWLFPRVAVVVHAAGAGVTAAGLRAGVPAIPLPYTSPDQPFWGATPRLARREPDRGVATPHGHRRGSGRRDPGPR